MIPKTYRYGNSVVTSKPRRFCLYELEAKRRRRYGRTYSVTVSQVYAQRRVLRIERTFMALEYGSRPERTLWHLFPRCAIVAPNSSQGT